MKNQMFKTSVAVGLASLCPALSQAAMFSSGTLNQVIPDYNLITATPGEWADQIPVGSFGSGWEISGVALTLNISGGWNGDLYAYLSYDDGSASTLITLMDRPGYSGSGYGYGDPGMAITLADGSYNPIEVYQGHSPVYNGSGQLTGFWNPDESFAAFDGMGANGTWTLYFTDLSPGSQSTVTEWSLDITAVPEPTTWALVLFGAALALVTLGRYTGDKWCRWRGSNPHSLTGTRF